MFVLVYPMFDLLAPKTTNLQLHNFTLFSSLNLFLSISREFLQVGDLMLELVLINDQNSILMLMASTCRGS